MSSGNNIKVVCRFRPQNKREIAEGGVIIVDVDDEGTNCRLDNGSDVKADFAFDRIFGPETRQIEIFEYGIRETLEDVFKGYNGTVFAYGQTGAGKTFSMMGNMDNDELKGIIPRIVETIFKSILQAPPTVEFTVKVAYMEIYMEKIRDLLNPVNDNLSVHEDKVRGIYVKGLVEVYVSTVAEVYEVLHRGGNARIVAYTQMNAESSRSHSIFQVTISQKNLNDGSVKSGRLYLVDLAGSEKVGKTGASGQTLEEAKKINKSLSALGMVINALTDGKSKHIPYRDSKLTRILQESLGGNSRTTLIINSSPSSFNDQETLSTLRFGMRAKSITNKAKVNADLSPAELKALLKKAKAETMSFQNYIKLLEGEVSVWRIGGNVPKDRWASIEKAKTTKSHQPTASASTVSPPTSPVPVSPPEQPKSLPSAPESVQDTLSRSPSPTTESLPDDEREAFLKRENELQDLITEKENEIASLTKQMETIKDELNINKLENKALKNENNSMSIENNTLLTKANRMSYEGKEASIAIDSLKEANRELLKEIDTLKLELNTHRQNRRESMEENKARKKSEKMALMMAELDTGAISAKEQAIRDTLQSLETMEGNNNLLTNAEAAALRAELSESRSLIEQQEHTVSDLQRQNELLTRKREEIEVRLSTLELEYEELLDKTIAEEEAGSTINIAESLLELKIRIESQYATKREQMQREIDELKEINQQKTEDVQKLNNALVELRRTNEDLNSKLMDAEKIAQNRVVQAGGVDYAEKEREMERIKKTMAQQLADFDVMKKALMRDLQNRCEKVVELEISLDEMREQYNQVIRNSSSKVQQKKMFYLERNLEQLTAIQRQLVDQNAQLKKDFAIAERKLETRNDRIASLESLLKDAQDKLTSQNQKFELQLAAVRERLEQARAQKPPPQNFFGSFGRIAKPLRGGGGQAADLNGPSISSVLDASAASANAANSNSTASKRTSWLWR